MDDKTASLPVLTGKGNDWWGKLTTRQKHNILWPYFEAGWTNTNLEIKFGVTPGRISSQRHQWNQSKNPEERKPPKRPLVHNAAVKERILNTKSGRKHQRRPPEDPELKGTPGKPSAKAIGLAMHAPAPIIDFSDFDPYAHLKNPKKYGI